MLAAALIRPAATKQRLCPAEAVIAFAFPRRASDWADNRPRSTTHADENGYRVEYTLATCLWSTS